MSRWNENPFWRDLVERLERQEAATDHAPLELSDDGAAWVHRPAELEAPPALLQGRGLVVDVSDRAVTLYPLGLAGRYRLSSSMGPRARDAALEYRPGVAELRDASGSTTVRVGSRLPVVEIARPGASGGAWVADGTTRRSLDAPVWWTPDDVPLDEVIARNNSTIPDPPPLHRPRAGVLARAVDDRIVIAVAAEHFALGKTMMQIPSMNVCIAIFL